MKCPSRIIVALTVWAAVSGGCGQPAEPPAQRRVANANAPATQPAPKADRAPIEPAPTQSAPVKPAPSEPTAIQKAPAEGATATPQAHRVEKLAPKRPENSWVIFREARDEAADATCDAQWLGGNRFSVETENIKRLTLDMTRLPKGAPAKGPWIVRLDGRNIELTGFKPKRGYTGHKRDLVCSKNGVWTVDKRKLYRTGG